LLLLHFHPHLSDLGLGLEVDQFDIEMQIALGRNGTARRFAVSELPGDEDLVAAALLHTGQCFREARNHAGHFHRSLFVLVKDGAVVELALIFDQHDVTENGLVTCAGL
jgi:hypothetical protein